MTPLPCARGCERACVGASQLRREEQKFRCGGSAIDDDTLPHKRSSAAADWRMLTATCFTEDCIDDETSVLAFYGWTARREQTIGLAPSK